MVKFDIKILNNNSQILYVNINERKISEKGDENNRIWHETAYGAFSRSFELTLDNVEEKIKAKFNNGVLNITIPKAEEVKPSVKKITIN